MGQCKNDATEVSTGQSSYVTHNSYLVTFNVKHLRGFQLLNADTRAIGHILMLYGEN